MFGNEINSHLTKMRNKKNVAKHKNPRKEHIFKPKYDKLNKTFNSQNNL